MAGRHLARLGLLLGIWRQGRCLLCVVVHWLCLITHRFPLVALVLPVRRLRCVPGLLCPVVRLLSRWLLPRWLYGLRGGLQGHQGKWHSSDTPGRRAE